MLELYEKNRKEGKGGQKPDVVRSLIPTHAGSIHDNEVFETLSENHILVFDLPSSGVGEKFVSAELKILTLLVKNTSNEIGVSKILKVYIYEDSMKKLHSFQEIPIYHLNNTWVSLDLTVPVYDILRSNSKSRLLSIMITVSAFLPEVSGKLKLSLMPDEEDFEFDYPILLLSYSSSKNTNEDIGKQISNKIRVKRNIEDDYEEETNKLWDDEISLKKTQIKKLKKLRNACKKKPLYVNFAEIHYDAWIVQPKGYEAYQCQGRCFYPVAEHLNPTKHAIVQALLHSVAPSKVQRSCCVPTILEPISILYVDINGVLTYRYAYRDMVVVECGCR